MTLRKSPRVFLLSIGILILLYLVLYFILSLLGGYMHLRSGHSRPIILATEDTWFWQPRFGRFHPFTQVGGQQTYIGDSLGTFFAPLVLLDQRFVHRTISQVSNLTPGWPDMSIAPPESQWHPQLRREVTVARAIWQKYEKKYKDAISAKDGSAREQVWGEYIAEVERTLGN